MGTYHLKFEKVHILWSDWKEAKVALYRAKVPGGWFVYFNSQRDDSSSSLLS